MTRSTLDLYKTDCRHFRPDRPCAPHKEHGAVCDGCASYDPVKHRLLILKVGAVGDVLRTTALLSAAREKFPGCFVTWVTDPASDPLFEAHRAVDRVLPFSWETLVRLRQEKFDSLWSLDVDPAVAAWAAELKASDRRGFTYADGLLHPLNAEADGWLALSLDDRLKRANRRTYQDWMFRICGLPWNERHRPLWTVTDEEKKWAGAMRSRWRLPAGNRVLGLNTGAGGRWQQKKWTQGGLESFLKLIGSEKKVSVLLLGGPEERERNRLLRRKFPRAIDTGCDNPLRRFGALVGLCDLVVTGDTLAMHIAIALRKRTVVMFGPTSSTEIELYGRGEKVAKDWDCLPCYRAECLRAPNCMEALSANDVVGAVRRQLAG